MKAITQYEYGSAKEVNVALKPENLTFEQAAAVPTSALTAFQGLRDQGEIAAGQRVLIIGGEEGGRWLAGTDRPYGLRGSSPHNREPECHSGTPSSAR